mgnify:CR=1 FL=1
MSFKGKLPEKLWEIRAKHGHSTFRKELINEVNKLGVTKKQLEDGYAYKNGFLVKVENILKGSLDSISSPSPSVKIQIMGGKVCLMGKGKTLLAIVSKLFVSKCFAFTPFLPII